VLQLRYKIISAIFLQIGGKIMGEEYVPSREETKIIREKLKDCKQEWLESKQGKRGQGTVNYIGWNTVRQIIDAAVDGLTYWDFGIIDQWRQEINDGKTGNMVGWVYQVKAYIYIPGLGRREQFGKKIAIGGVNNQDSAFQAAASNALSKCASLFGVGEKIYAKIKIETEDNNSYGNSNYTDQQQAPYNQQQWGQPQENWNQQQPNDPNWNSVFHQVDQQMSQGNVQTPFDPTPQAVPNQFQAMPQPTAQPQNMPNSQYGAPVNAGGGMNASAATQQATTNPQNNVLNPWQEKGVQNELLRYRKQKERLKVNNDDQMIPYLRDYFKSENASLNNLTPDNLKSFNDYLDKVSA
jgi:hypothetical protein